MRIIKIGKLFTGSSLISFSPEILEEVLHTQIPEIYDRIIVATAKFYKAWILTKDKIIRESGEVEKL